MLESRRRLRVRACRFADRATAASRVTPSWSSSTLDERRVHEAGADDLGAVAGSSTEDDVLLAAGIDRAATLIVSLASDADAMSTVLSARALNPTLRIIARGERIVERSQAAARRMRSGRQPAEPGCAPHGRIRANSRTSPTSSTSSCMTKTSSISSRSSGSRAGSEIAGVALGDAHLRRQYRRAGARPPASRTEASCRFPDPR